MKHTTSIAIKQSINETLEKVDSFSRESGVTTELTSITVHIHRREGEVNGVSSNARLRTSLHTYVPINPQELA